MIPEPQNNQETTPLVEVENKSNKTDEIVVDASAITQKSEIPD